MSTAVLERPAVASGLLTAEEFYDLPETDGCELVGGKVVPKHKENEMSGPGGKHGKIAVRIGGRMEAYATPRKLGDVYAESGFTLPSGDVRRPDISFLEASQLTDGTPDGFPIGAPTLAVEVISPNDLWHEVEEKLDVYFEAGTKVVWLVDPKRQTVTVRRPGGPAANYIVGEIIPGGEILPGFELPVADIFA